MAAAVPDATATAISDALAPLRARFPDTRWLPPEKLHLTLVFLGASDPATIPSREAALARVALRHVSFDVATVDAGGRASGRRGGVAWLRLGGGAAAWSRLALDVDQEIGSFSFGERLQPRPHLTVARRVDETALGALRDWATEREPFAWQVDRLTLFRSHLDPAGSRYEALMTASLSGGPGDAD